MLLIEKAFAKLPRALEGTKPVLIYPFFGIVLIGAIMVFIINHLSEHSINGCMTDLQVWVREAKCCLELFSAV